MIVSILTHCNEYSFSTLDQLGCNQRGIDTYYFIIIIIIIIVVIFIQNRTFQLHRNKRLITI